MTFYVQKSKIRMTGDTSSEICKPEENAAKREKKVNLEFCI